MERLTDWKLVYTKFVPKKESLREALCTLGNGYFAVRGSLFNSQVADNSYPATYFAGGYNKLATAIAGKTIVNEDFVNCPNWTFFNIKIGKGDWFSLSDSKIINFRQELDMRTAQLIREITFKDRQGKETFLQERRFVSMKDAHLANIQYKIIPQNYTDQVHFKSLIDGTVINDNVARYRKLNPRHLETVSGGSWGDNCIYLIAQTNQSKLKIAEAVKMRIFSGQKEVKPSIRVHKKNIEKKRSFIEQNFKLKLEKKKPYIIEKSLAFYTCKDKNIKYVQEKAINKVKGVSRYNVNFVKHKRTWRKLWDTFDMQIEKDVISQAILRFHVFHLLQTASFNTCDLDAGMPARGLHGEAYRGHIFWDTLFVMPFYNLHAPKIAKSLMLYRHRRLPAARKYAKKAGFKGAMFPWQSGSTGEEESQVLHLNPVSNEWGPDYSRRQRHISFDIAYSFWQYWIETKDKSFLRDYGAELILSVAQFAGSLVRYDPKDKRYHADGIMGPDEFHEKYPHSDKPGLRDNAYTNFMIVWTLMRAEEVLDILSQKKRKELKKKLNIKEKDLERWQDIAKRMNIIIRKDGIIEQFKGYFSLKEVNWEYYRKKYGDIHRMDRILKAEGKSPDAYKVSKQADVLMIFYLFSLSQVKTIFNQLGYKFHKSMVKNNFEYYQKRTSHGSSLSNVVHCFIAQFLGKKQKARQWFKKVLDTDIHDIQGGTTSEGIHTGTMGGSLDIVMQCFAGIDFVKDNIYINPHLLKQWNKIKFKFLYRKVWIYLEITRKHVILLLKPKDRRVVPQSIWVQGKEYNIAFGRKKKISLT